MKKILAVLSALLIGANAFWGCAHNQASSPDAAEVQASSLDAAVQAAAKAVNGNLAPGIKVAVISFNSSSPAFTDYILDELAIAIGNGKKVTVIDRQYADAVRKEMAIQASGDVADDEMKRFGYQLGASAVITGSLVDNGTAYRFRVVAINVESAAREAQAVQNIAINDPQVTFLLTGKRPDPAAAAPAASGKAYKIGGRGPGGGFVFYDKGVVSNGWRYLEAAPHDLGPVQWGLFGTMLGGTLTGLGTGRQNTERIIAALNRIGNSDRAAQLCTAFEVNRCKDWFLPSKDELDLMYKNLKAKGLGAFGGGWYWSSSEIDNLIAWPQRFSDGSQNYSNFYKNNTGSVRAVRAF
ncbi:MAG: DUF1566 domain-containing protein [Treponema sp.]|nr:DUF1566 domain-containing protein [Treponema sp.]